MTDPYEVLGVSRSASTDDIKKAYRKLSRIYHPDANMDNPNKDQAEEKFKQIQAAYKQIMDEKDGKTFAGGGYGGGAWYQNTGSYTTADSEEEMRMGAAANYINNGYFQEAMNVLNDLERRNAKWYYLHAMCQSAMGNQINAVEEAEQAVSMEPDNFQYQALLNQLRGGGVWYRNAGQGYGYNREFGGPAKWCCECLAFNMMCNCCCGPGIFCC